MYHIFQLDTHTSKNITTGRLQIAICFSECAKIYQRIICINEQYNTLILHHHQVLCFTNVVLFVPSLVVLYVLMLAALFVPSLIILFVFCCFFVLYVQIFVVLHILMLVVLFVLILVSLYVLILVGLLVPILVALFVLIVVVLYCFLKLVCYLCLSNIISHLIAFQNKRMCPAMYFNRQCYRSIPTITIFVIHYILHWLMSHVSQQVF